MEKLLKSIPNFIILVKSRKIIAAILLISLGIFLGLVLSEIAIRFVNPQLVFSVLPHEGPSCYLPDPMYSIKMRPHSVCHRRTNEFEINAKTNNLGFRGDKDINIQNPIGSRILFLGDSFTLGEGVLTTDSYPEKVGQILDQNSIKNEVLNGSVEGTEMTRDYIFLRENAKKLQPKIVVVGFFLGNDLIDIKDISWIGQDELGLPQRIESSFQYVDSDGTVRMKFLPTRYKIPFFRDSHLFIFLAKVLFGNKEMPTDIVISGDQCLIVKTCHDFDESIERTKELFLGMKRLSERDNFKLVVAILPSEIQLPTILIKRSGLNIIVNNQRRHFISDQFVNFFKDQGILSVDILNTFDNYSGQNQVFYPQNRHWTATGHELTAQALTPVIKDLLDNK